MTTIAIVEDNRTMRQTLREWIDQAAGMRCVCVCPNAKEAIVTIPQYSPDVVLMDINLPDGENGIACTARRLKGLLPKIQIIILTVYKDHELIFQALKAGACGYLLKRSSREDILRAITDVRTGGAPMTGEIARMLVETFQKPPAQTNENLSPREMEVLVLVAKGLTNKEIAEQLTLSFDTVRNHLRHIYEKLHVRCRTEAVMKYHAGENKTPSSQG